MRYRVIDLNNLIEANVALLAGIERIPSPLCKEQFATAIEAAAWIKDKPNGRIWDNEKSTMHKYEDLIKIVENSNWSKDGF